MSDNKLLDERGLIIKMEKRCNKDYLQIEYEQTVQTLRNWDTLFFNTFSSIIISGGVGGIVIAGKSVNFKYFPEVIIGIITALYLVFVLYFIYNLLIASKKFSVLREIEIELHLIGAYKESSPKYLNYVFLPIITFFYVITMFIII